MDSREYEKAALENLDKVNPGAFLVAQTYATLAVLDELRKVRKEVEWRERG